jgi:hypothetical protein
MAFLTGSQGTSLAATLVFCLFARETAHAQPRTGPGRVPMVPYQPQPLQPSYDLPQSGALYRAQAPERSLRNWYGYQIMLTDFASVAMGLASKSAEMAFSGYFIAPIVVHGVHHRPVLAVVSPVSRLALPALGAGIGSGLGGCSANHEACGLGGAIYGAAFGAVVAMILDWSWAWNPAVVPAPISCDDEFEDEGRRSLRSSGPALTTAGLAPYRTGVSLVVGGQF